MWLATFRLAEVVALDHPLSRLRRELRLHDLCEEIVLDPFSESEVSEYLAQTGAVRQPRRGIRASLARTHRRIAAVRRLGHDRCDGLVLATEWTDEIDSILDRG
jgi:hypothetical protein